MHLVGIGGVGLSAIARVLLQRGFRVSGSDRAANTYTEALQRDGATIHIGHDAANIAGAELVIITSAASRDNPEIAAAAKAEIPVYKRSEIIMDVIAAGLSSVPFVIAVAGTHGKTTTTAMITHILLECGLNPGYIIGGSLSSTGTNGAAGSGELFVIEADEYDNMYHGLAYDLAVITNIEWDHPDFFKTYADLLESFRKFVTRSQNGRCCTIVCEDDAGVSDLRAQVDAATIGLQTYGRASIKRIRQEGEVTIFDLADTDYTVRITRPGMHNVLNALGALQAVFMLHWFGDFHDRFTLESAVRALESFTGTGRRFEIMGTADGVTVINDYAHHPTAIRATLQAAKMRYPDSQLWAVWQPHTFSRTRALWNEYASAFGTADHVLVTDIYAARELPDGETTALRIVEAIAGQHVDVRYVAYLDDAARLLIRDAVSPAVILIMSAGDAPVIGTQFLAARGNGEKPSRPQSEPM